nr:hypothetical protein [Oceanococcus sp. HetDA_MAG_MS8]
MRVSRLSAATSVVAIFMPLAVFADHGPGELGVVNAPTASTLNSGGDGAVWEVFTSLNSANPHSDLDYFRVDGDYYVAAGTLAIGPNEGGQVIYRLTQNGELDPSFVAAHGSAACVTDASAALALQHDVEVTPKGDVLFNTDWKGMANTGRPQILIDATDAPGRCHDQGTLVGLAAAGFDQPPGGLELVDITDLANPVEIHLTSHIGEAHTVNVDPRRPHIVYTSTSDYVTLANRPDAADPTRSEQGDLDGFEMLDISSCMNFPEGTDLATKRAQCRPQVYRFRFEPDWIRGTFDSGRGGACHELELYPDDRLACASLSSTLVLDMSGVFDDNGTPNDYTDDTIRGEPLPCAVRKSASDELGVFATGALVTDCVLGAQGRPLTMGGWLEQGAPSVEGVELVGFVNHAANSGRLPADDVAISHEAEFTHSGKFLLVSDERGGGVTPPDATCPTPGSNEVNADGNGGIHAYAVDRLYTEYPGSPGADTAEAIAQAADVAYARTPDGDKAIYRATPRMVGGTFCTAHLFQQIPGQNRIFMGWYSQGTQVVDYIENPDGSFEWKEAAWWIPEGGTQWVSHIFAFEENADGSFTYWGTSADISRTAVDVYSVTLPAPEQMQPAVQVPTRDVPLPRPAAPSTGGAVSWWALLVLLGLGGASAAAQRHRAVD